MDSRSFDLSNLQEKNYYSLLADLIKYIKSKHYNEGDRLPQESVLALELNTNRSTLREMLRVLEVMGIIDSKRGSANVYLGNLEVGFMNMFLISSMLRDGQPQDICLIRASIEADAIEEFVKKASDADIYRLEIILGEHMYPGIDKQSPEYLEAHLRFHEQLMKYYNNETAKEFVRSNLRLIKRNYEDVLEKDPNVPAVEKEAFRRRNYASSHKMIILAVKERDASKARDLIIEHSLASASRNSYT